MRAPWRRATRHRIAAREHEMPGVEQQAHVVAGVGHQAIDLGFRLHDGAHVVMEREAHAALLADARATALSFAQNSGHCRVGRAPADAKAARTDRRRCCRDLRRTP